MTNPNTIQGISRYLNTRQLKGLSKVGDIVAPANGEFPSFSQAGCIEHIDHVMAATHPEDLQGFKLLMSVFSIMPAFLIELLLKIIDQEDKFPNFMGGLLRMMGIGVKGVIFSLYYSSLGSQYHQGRSLYDVIDYRVQCNAD